MHELGVVIEVVKTVQEFAKDNGVTVIDSVTLQIGELSAMIPRFIEECWPCAVDGTSMQDTKLSIEVIRANARCSACGKVYPLLDNKDGCPHCSEARKEILNGREFMIKEISAY